MDYIRIAEAAEKWGISARRVQILCAEGKIEGAVRFGRNWMIPAHARRPADGRKKTAEQAVPDRTAPLPMPRQSPFLDMTDLYTIAGSADKCIAALAHHPEAQALFAAEIAYSRGEIEKVMRYARYFLNSHSDMYAVLAGGMLLALSAMWRGDITLYREAKVHICEAPCKSDSDRDLITLSLACINSAVSDLSSYPDWFARGQFEQLPPDAHPAAKVFYIKRLLIFAQELAKDHIHFPDVSGLGLIKTLPYIIEPLIAQEAAQQLVIPQIYLRLLAAIAYHQCNDDQHAVFHLDKAITLTLPDGLLGILAEHRKELDSLLDERLMLADPDAFRKYKKLQDGLHIGWTKLHNSLLSKSVSNALTVRERECARLAAFGISNNAIAEQMHISLPTVRKLLFNAMNKTGAEKRKELGAFV